MLGHSQGWELKSDGIGLLHVGSMVDKRRDCRSDGVEKGGCSLCTGEQGLVIGKAY